MRIDSLHASSGTPRRASLNDIMSQPAPAHVDTLRWNLADAGERRQLLKGSPAPTHEIAGSGPSSHRSPEPQAVGGIVWGTGRGLSDAGRGLERRGAQSTLHAQRLLNQSSDIFKRYPAQYSQHWDFTTSAVSGKGGASGPLSAYLNNHGVQHNGTAPHAPPRGSVVNAAQAAQAGVPTNKINNHNGAVAGDALAHRLRAQGYAVQQNVIVDTPLGKREVDVLATKHVGHPTLSQELRFESKVGGKSLPGVAQGSNVRRQIDKDAAALAAHNANAPGVQARGRDLHARGNAALNQGEQLAHAGRAAKTVGKIARPLGVVISAFEVGSAFKADGHKVGVHTMGKAASLAGGAGGAWAGAAAGAALGSVVPGVGTVIGGLVGGIVGGLAGEAVMSKAFSAVKSWF